MLTEGLGAEQSVQFTIEVKGTRSQADPKKMRGENEETKEVRELDFAAGDLGYGELMGKGSKGKAQGEEKVQFNPGALI